jgi:hypothetical protein
MGFSAAVVPVNTPQVEGIALLRAGSISHALRLVGLVEGPSHVVPNVTRSSPRAAALGGRDL